jgi:heme-degrading monooxygenase HmoA
MVKGHIKPGKLESATRLLEKDVIPLLKKQHGFRDEVSCFGEGADEGFAISFWDSKADLDRYEREVYPQVRDKMRDLFQDQPITHSYEVNNSTWYHIHAV